jgi:cell division protein FtsI/penicillin-binding protein 2
MHHRTYRIRRRAGATLATLALVTGGLAGCSKPGPDDALKDFLAGWPKGDLHTVGFIAADGSAISAADVVTQIQDLSGDLAKQPPALSAVGGPKTSGDLSTSDIKLDWTLPGGTTHWAYQSTVRLTKQGTKGWRVIWEPAILQPNLESGDKLKVRRVGADRAGILDAVGKPIVVPRDVVTIGVEPQRITNLPQLTQGLAAAFKTIGADVDLSTLKDRVDSAKKDAFVELITLRQADWNKISAKINALTGRVIRTEKRDLAPTRAFARALLGTADVATREDIDKNPGTVALNDIVGHGGLQQRYDSTLRGTPGQSVVIARTAPDDTVTDTSLFKTEPVAGKPIKTSIDVTTQLAADQALTIQKQPSSLIAIKISDGSVLAVANGPDGGTVNTALTGQVPPGSTYKTVTAYGLLAKKAVQADTPVDCPKTLLVAGREFKNSKGEVLGKVPFHVDYSKSCNTAFAGLAPRLGAAGLQQASAALGIGGQWDLGIDASSGKVSAAGSPTELAAAAFGQGATVVSPLAMANVAASVARGQLKQPRLVLDPAPAKPAADGAPLDAAAVKALQGMMREVVTSGTGVALKSVPGKPVYGKTGTAEFDDKSADTHSWFIGYQGDVAFAVMVQKGGAGSEAAVPIVSRFLTALNK